MFEFTYEVLTVAASNPHFIFLVCNLIIVTLMLVSLEPTSRSDNDHNKHTATPIPSPPPPPNVSNRNKSFETTTRVTLQEETTQNVLIDVDKEAYDCNISVDKVSCDRDLSVDKVSYDCNISVNKVSCDRDLSVDKVSYDCNISVNKVSCDRDLSVDKVSYDCNLSVEEHEELLEDDELRRRVEEFIDKINSGWKAEKMSLIYDQLNSSTREGLLSYGSKSR